MCGYKRIQFFFLKNCFIFIHTEIQNYGYYIFFIQKKTPKFTIKALNFEQPHKPLYGHLLCVEGARNGNGSTDVSCGNLAKM